MSGEEQLECPLCMDPLEIDDKNFFPCTCGYQICRFCWHRIRTDENGLCPACRKQYSEDPAEFKPLTDDELQRIKKEKRQKDLQRKQKAAENRKHLANVRVVQKNLVFVVGLSQRLADPEVLKKHEYFGKFGKIHKVVINQSTSYAGAQGPSASAYVTYHRSEDALRAIMAVNNVHVDGRTLKASLGTTKYCSHFLKGAQCPKSDCMYLHELGEEAASFTKEEMQMGKHQEYEQKLLEQFMNSQNIANNHLTTSKIINSRKKTTSPTTVTQPSPPQQSPISQPLLSHHPQQTPPPPPPPNAPGKDAWPLFNSNTNGSKLCSMSRLHDHGSSTSTKSKHVVREADRQSGSQKSRSSAESTSNRACSPTPATSQSLPTSTKPTSHPPTHSAISHAARAVLEKRNSESLSFFSGNGFPSDREGAKRSALQQSTGVPDSIPSLDIPDTIPVASATDWQAAFGFAPKGIDWQDDDLGFDPWDESSKALADLMEKENGVRENRAKLFQHMSMNLQGPTQVAAHHPIRPPSHPHSLPPGFSINHIQQQQQLHQLRPEFTVNKVTDFMNFTQPKIPPVQNSYHPAVLPDMHMQGKEHLIHNNAQLQHHDGFHVKDLQDGLRALLPNINISFSAPLPPQPSSTVPTQNPAQNSSYTCMPDNPHWMKSIQQLTEFESHGQNNRLPFVQQYPFRGAAGWVPETHNPPPGFQTQIRSPSQNPEPHKVTDGLQ